MGDGGILGHFPSAPVWKPWAGDGMHEVRGGGPQNISDEVRA